MRHELVRYRNERRAGYFGEDAPNDEPDGSLHVLVRVENGEVEIVQASDLDVLESFENGSWPTPPGDGWWTCRAWIEGASYHDDSARPTIEYRCNWRAIAVADFGRDGPFDLDDLAVVIGRKDAA